MQAFLPVVCAQGGIPLFPPLLPETPRISHATPAVWTPLTTTRCYHPMRAVVHFVARRVLRDPISTLTATH